MTALFVSDDLTHAVGGIMTSPFHATGVSIDTRTLQPGDLFVALQTATGDGHAHVAAALARGAAGAMVHRQHDMPDDAKLIVVGDTLAGLQALGAYARARFTGAVVAVTGSVGKTTTKEMLRLALGAQGRTNASVASYNNHWGVPLTLARMPPDDDFAVIEIGMNHPGEIAPLAMLAGPDVAVITAISTAHVGHMGSLDAIADEKATIAQGVLQGGAVVLPGDSPFYRRMATLAGDKRVLSFSMREFDVLTEDARGTHFTGSIAGAPVSIRLAIPGRHMAANAIAALTAVHALGGDVQAGAHALANFAPVGGRGTIRPILDGRATLLDESYNASSASVKAALSVLALLPAQRRIAVLGDMLELGDFSRAEHEGLVDWVSESADVVYACGSSMKFMYDALPAGQRGAYAEHSTKLAPLVRGGLREGDTVLVKGSLGSRMNVVVAALTAMESS